MNFVETIGRCTATGRVHHAHHPTDQPPAVRCHGVFREMVSVLGSIDDGADIRPLIVSLGLLPEELCGRCWPNRVPYWRRFRQEMRWGAAGVEAAGRLVEGLRATAARLGPDDLREIAGRVNGLLQDWDDLLGCGAVTMTENEATRRAEREGL